MLQPTELPPEAPISSKKAKWRNLSTLSDVRLALASVIKKTYDGRLAVERAAVCVAGLRALGKVIVDETTAPVRPPLGSGDNVSPAAAMKVLDANPRGPGDTSN